MKPYQALCFLLSSVARSNKCPVAEHYIIVGSLLYKCCVMSSVLVLVFRFVCEEAVPQEKKQSAWSLSVYARYVI